MKNIGTNGDLVVTGSEIIGVANNATSGTIIMMVDFNPVTWTSTRIARMVPLFETYKIMGLRITYVPACSTTTSGLVFMYYDRDPNDPPIGNINTPANLSRLMSNQNAVAGQAWKPATLSYSTGPSDNNAYFAAPVTDSGDLRLTSQGMAYAYTNATTGTLAGGIFKIDYNIKLLTPTGPTGVPNSYSGFTYLNMSYVANTTATPAPAQMTFSFSMASEVVYQVLTEFTTTILVDGFAKILAPYTPYYMRYFNASSVWRMYSSLDNCLTASSDILQVPANGAGNGGYGWIRSIINIAGASANETV